MTKVIRLTAAVLVLNSLFHSAASCAAAQESSRTESDASSAADVLRSARSIVIVTRSVYFKPATLENELLKRREFEQWGLVITREEKADLIIDVDRKVFTTHFVYSVIDRRTSRVLMSGGVDSIGGTVEGKIADNFMKRMKQIRPVTGQPQIH